MHVKIFRIIFPWRIIIIILDLSCFKVAAFHLGTNPLSLAVSSSVCLKLSSCFSGLSLFKKLSTTSKIILHNLSTEPLSIPLSDLR